MDPSQDPQQKATGSAALGTAQDNTLYDQTTNNSEIDAEMQKRLNTPTGGHMLDEEDEKLKKLILELVSSGKINLYTPSSLLNESVYEALAPDAKVKAEMNASAMLTKIREIVKLHKAEMDTGYQEYNLIHSLRLNKERLEELSGDIFII